MFPVFTRPHRGMLATVFLTLAVLGPWGRFIAFDGESWTALTLVGTAAAFAAAARSWPALKQLGIPGRRYRLAAAGTGAVWTIILASVITLSMGLMQRDNPYYKWYDWFLVTAGDRHYLDTNGEPYLLEGLGQSVGTLAFSWVFVALSLAAAVIIGLGIGLARNWVVILAGTIVSLGVVWAIVGGIRAWLYATNFTLIDGMLVDISREGGDLHPGIRLLILIGCVLVPVVLSLVIIARRTRRSCLKHRKSRLPQLAGSGTADKR